MCQIIKNKAKILRLSKYIIQGFGLSHWKVIFRAAISAEKKLLQGTS